MIFFKLMMSVPQLRLLELQCLETSQGNNFLVTCAILRGH